MSEPLVTVEHLSKKFCKDLKLSLLYGLQDLQHEMIFPDHNKHATLRKGEFWALDDVSFDLRRGESLALLGRNGAGKSTLLKVLNGLIKPDIGRVTIHGRVGALIELGAGFNPVLTGRENIFVNGSILGFTKQELDDIFDQIVDFSELEGFIDTPVQYYSSGMKVRLGFSVAVNMRPDILLIDEVLAVGDVGFRNKCYNAVQTLMKDTAVIFVSHSITQVAKVCNRGILMQDGRIALMSDRVEKVVDGYLGEFESNNQLSVTGTGVAQLVSLSVLGPDQAEPAFADFTALDEGEEPPPVQIEHGSAMTIEAVLTLDPAIREFYLGYEFEDMESKGIAQCYSMNSNTSFENAESGPVSVRVSLPRVELNQGRYGLGLRVWAKSGGAFDGEKLLVGKGLLDIQVTSPFPLYGAAPMHLAGSWDGRD